MSMKQQKSLESRYLEKLPVDRLTQRKRMKENSLRSTIILADGVEALKNL